MAGALPPTPRADTPREGDAAAAATDLEEDPYGLNTLDGNLADMLPDTPVADIDDGAEAEHQQEQHHHLTAHEGTEAAAPHGTPTKTYQRRNVRQQQQQDKQGAEGAAAEDVTGRAGAGTSATAAKAAKKRRVSGLLGHKRRMVVDDEAEPAAAGEVSRRGKLY